MRDKPTSKSTGKPDFYFIKIDLIGLKKKKKMNNNRGHEVREGRKVDMKSGRRV